MMTTEAATRTYTTEELRAAGKRVVLAHDVLLKVMEAGKRLDHAGKAALVAAAEALGASSAAINEAWRHGQNCAFQRMGQKK